MAQFHLRAHLGGGWQDVIHGHSVLSILPNFEHDFGPLEIISDGFYRTLGCHADGSALELEVEVGVPSFLGSSVF
jgi:hypothetical protein